MDGGVLKLVLFLVVEDHAVVVHEVQDAHLPNWPAEELHQEVVLPFLSGGRDTSSASYSLVGLRLGGSSSLLLPNSH